MTAKAPIIEPPLPALRKVNPQGGRPKDELAELSNTIARGKNYYLANAEQSLLYTAIHETPVICIAECAYNDACSLPEEQRPRTTIHPLYGERCPIEAELISTIFYGYCAELGIDQGHVTEIQTALALAEIQVWKRRINMRIMADTDGELTVTKIMPGGGSEQIKHPLFDVRVQLEKREETILKQFLATRKEASSAAAAQKASQRKSGAEWLADLDDVIDIEVVTK